VKLFKWPEKSRPVVYVLLIFLCGIVTGALAHNLWHRWERDQEQRVAQAAAPQRNRTQRTVERFTRDLQLNPEQAQQLAVILDETRRQYRTHEDATRQEARNRIREILSDQQRAQYEEIIRRNDEHRRQQQQQRNR